MPRMQALSRRAQVEAVRKGPWMQTYTGRRIHPLDVRPEDIHILDIVQGLAHEPRFSGQTVHAFNVAQHSCLVMARTEQLAGARGIIGGQLQDLLRWALLHDAPEAFLKDLAGPIKSCLPGYMEMEARFMDSIAERFGLFPLGHEVPELVKTADRELCITEAAMHYGHDTVQAWGWDVKPLPAGNKITATVFSAPWTSDEAGKMFNAAFFELFSLWPEDH